MQPGRSYGIQRVHGGEKCSVGFLASHKRPPMLETPRALQQGHANRVENQHSQEMGVAPEGQEEPDLKA